MFALFCPTTFMKNTLPTCTAVLSATDVLCFPCLTHCYYFINGNAGLFKNSYPIIPKWFDLLCFFSLFQLTCGGNSRSSRVTCWSCQDHFWHQHNCRIWRVWNWGDTSCTKSLPCKEPFISWHFLSYRGYWLKQNSMSVIGANLWPRLCNR